MTIQRIKQEIVKLKEDAVKKRNIQILENSKKELDELKTREEMKQELGEMKRKLEYYEDMGIFEKNWLERDFDINCVDNLPTDLIQRWKNRDSMTIKEKIQLDIDIGIFTQE